MMRTALLCLLTVVALGAAACGSGDGDEASESTAASSNEETTPTETTPTEATQPDDNEGEPESQSDNSADSTDSADSDSPDITTMNMCDLLTAEQLSVVIDGSFTSELEEADLETNGNSPSCTWSSAGSVDLTESGVTGLVLVGLSQQNFDLNRGFWSTLEDVDGIGDEAYLVQEGSILYVRSGTNGFWVTMTGSSDMVSGEAGRQTLTELANQVLANL